MQEKKLRMTAEIFGKVQGVFFRASTERQAIMLGLVGTVQNKDDGSVYLIAEGGEENLKTLEAWCHHGPPGAKVSNLKVKYSSPTHEFTHFGVI